MLCSNILSFVEKVFKVLALIANWISQRDKSNKLPKQASIHSWLHWVAIIYIYEAGYDRLFDAVLSDA